MKLRHILLLAIGTLLLAACNLTLAEDVTPPPDYVPPTPLPDLGPMYPASAPNLENGKAIFAEKCAPCHGATGLGDGEQGKDLPVTVIPIGLPEYGKKSTPAEWYTIVSQGNLDRFMPPFYSLTDQDRWDVVSYAFTLHTTNEQVDSGKALLEENCADCAEIFQNREMMSALSEDDIVSMIREGGANLPAFGSGFSDEQAYAVAAYARTLMFAPPPAPVAVEPTQTSAPADASITPTDGTPVSGTPQAEVTPEATEAVQASVITGRIDNRLGKDLPADLAITLKGYEHGADPNAGPQEFLSLEGAVNPDGSYAFDIPISESEIYQAEVTVEGLSYQSEFGIVQTGATDLILPDIIVYQTTDDLTPLQVTSLQIFMDMASEGDAQIFAVYSITNTSDKTVIVKMDANQNVPFIAFPEGSSGLGYEAAQDSASFIQTADGFAMPPSTTPYGLIAFASIPKAKEIEIKQPALLPINEVVIFLPEGVTAKGDTLNDHGIQPIQNTNFQMYTSGAINKDASLVFTINGEPKDTTATADVTQNRNLLIGVGALGLVLILAGVFMFLRDKKKEEEAEEEDGSDFEDSESVMDAIIAIDELHRSGKMSDEAYQKRRDELKNELKRKG
ncbi:MAG TPA: c-type cytochrome [Anaerolineales bacterium]|nr:c-type cytochrome [Anaerolineales bacterium]